MKTLRECGEIASDIYDKFQENEEAIEMAEDEIAKLAIENGFTPIQVDEEMKKLWSAEMLDHNM